MVRVLHDRRIPRSRADIDHLVVCPTGVLVVDVTIEGVEVLWAKRLLGIAGAAGAFTEADANRATWRLAPVFAPI